MKTTRTLVRSLMVAVLIPSAVAGADTISFGARSSERKINEFCSRRISVPHLEPGPGASAALVNDLVAKNVRFAMSLASLTREFEERVKEADMCKDLGSSYQVAVESRLATPLDAPVASIVTRYSMYSGGAHGLHDTSSLNFNAQTGEVYGSMAAYFEASKTAALKAALLAKLKTDPTFDAEFGWKSWDAAHADVGQIANFYLESDGIVFYFNEYEVAPFASGLVKATLYWGELEEIGMKKTGAPTLIRNPGF